MRRLKISQLETFVVYMKTGSVTQAAYELNTTQPNASKKLKQIEDAVGFQLFARAGGKLRPTPEAEMLYEHVVRLMQHLDVIESFGLDSSPLKKQSLRVATLASFGIALIPMATREFRRTHPDFRIQVDALDSEKIHSMVAQGLYDFGFVHYPEEEAELTSKTLAQASIVCLVPRHHPLAEYDVVKASDLRGVQVVTYGTTVRFGAVISKMTADAGFPIDHPVSTNHSHIVRKFVEHGGGVGLVDRFSVCDGESFESFVIKPFEPHISISLGLIVPQRRPLSRTAQGFVEQVEAIASGVERR